MPNAPRTRVFVDESKARGYYLAAAVTIAEEVSTLERRLRALRAGGRSTIHFNGEGDRRDMLLREMSTMPVVVTVYATRGRRDGEARALLLRELVGDVVTRGGGELVLDRDESVEQGDRRTIRDRLGELGALQAVTYRHASDRDEPVLWIADAAAWCYQKGGPWPSKIAAIASLIRVP